jgi:hypothetical protein
LAYQRRSWVEKMVDKPGLPKVIPLDPKYPCGKALLKMGARPGEPIVLAQPMEIKEIVGQVPEGRLITIKEVCGALARRHGAAYGCTLVTGIHIMIVAQAAHETNRDTPYWCTLSDKTAVETCDEA